MPVAWASSGVGGARPARPVRTDGAEFLPGFRAAMARFPKAVWVGLAIALVLRVALVALTWHTPVTLDPSDFSRTAASVAHGHGYPATNRAPGGGPSAFRPPGYP